VRAQTLLARQINTAGNSTPFGRVQRHQCPHDRFRSPKRPCRKRAKSPATNSFERNCLGISIPHQTLAPPSSTFLDVRQPGLLLLISTHTSQHLAITPFISTIPRSHQSPNARHRPIQIEQRHPKLRHRHRQIFSRILPQPPPPRAPPRVGQSISSTPQNHGSRSLSPCRFRASAY